MVDAGAAVGAKDVDGRTPLHWAASGGREELCRWLLGRGAEVNTADDGGWTPLASAASAGHLGVVKLLLSNGGDANVRSAETNAIALHHHKGREAIVEALLPHTADIDVKFFTMM